MIFSPWLLVGAGALYLAGVGSGMAWSSDRAEAKRNKAAVAQLTVDIQAQQDQAARLHKANEVTHEELDRARAAAARAAATSLRGDAAAQATRIAAAAPDCAAANAAAAVYTELLGSADARAGELAAEADERRARGIGCERHYEAIKLSVPEIPDN